MCIITGKSWSVFKLERCAMFALPVLSGVLRFTLSVSSVPPGQSPLRPLVLQPPSQSQPDCSNLITSSLTSATLQWPPPCHHLSDCVTWWVMEVLWSLTVLASVSCSLYPEDQGVVNTVRPLDAPVLLWSVLATLSNNTTFNWETSAAFSTGVSQELDGKQIKWGVRSVVGSVGSVLLRSDVRRLWLRSDVRSKWLNEKWC